MNKYILMIGLASVALGSYCAYAGNSATMTVTATIAHDVSLSVTQDLDLGTITINPAFDGAATVWHYRASGVISFDPQGAIVSAGNATVGTFTANIPNPADCDGTADCGGLSVDDTIGNFFGGSDYTNNCDFQIQYSGSANTFKVYPDVCYIGDISKVTTGTHSHTLTISYTPE